MERCTEARALDITEELQELPGRHEVTSKAQLSCSGEMSLRYGIMCLAEEVPDEELMDPAMH